jgi:hypothetical protein
MERVIASGGRESKTLIGMNIGKETKAELSQRKNGMSKMRWQLDYFFIFVTTSHDAIPRLFGDVWWHKEQSIVAKEGKGVKSSWK